MRRKWTTVYRNGVMVPAQLSADKEWLRGLIEVATADADHWREAEPHSLRDAEIVSAQLRASVPGPRSNVRDKGRVERLALGRCG